MLEVFKGFTPVKMCGLSPLGVFPHFGKQGYSFMLRLIRQIDISISTALIGRGDDVDGAISCHSRARVYDTSPTLVNS